MNALLLTTRFAFGIVPDPTGLRLIVFDGETEYVCHKSSVKEVAQFLEQPSAQLFKGRLQLKKHADVILINVKGNDIGAIGAGAFMRLLPVPALV